jgi:hypothetical protein
MLLAVAFTLILYRAILAIDRHLYRAILAVDRYWSLDPDRE